MNQHAKNKLKMYQTVRTICTDHQADWTNLPSFGIAFVQFGTALNELEQAAYDQGITTIGVRAAKQQLCDDTLALAEVVANALRAYAASIQDVLLIQQFHFSKWTFYRGGGQHMLQLVDRVLATAHPHITELADFGITQPQLDALNTLRTQLGVAVGAPRTAIVTRKMLTLTIGQRIRRIDELLKHQLDPLVGVVKPIALPFYEKYRAARMIMDHKGKRIAHGSGIDPVGEPEEMGPG
jgi:hypothetical protein